MTNVPASAQLARPRFLLLDFLRLCAAFVVMLYHYTAGRHENWGIPTIEQFGFVSRVSAYGFLGVQLFFVISGFVIFLSAEGRTVGQFVSARVSRLYPGYWAAVILTSALFLLSAPGWGKNPSVAQILMNLTMVQSAFGVDNIDGVYWTLWVELLFYVLIGLLISAGLTERRVYWFVFLWPIVGAVAQQTEFGFLSELLSPVYASLFAGGMMIYLIYSRGHSLIRWLLLAYSVCIATSQTVLDRLPDTERYTGLDLSPALTAVLVIGIFALVALVTITPLRYRGWKWMTYAGALTFPLYLVHVWWGWWVIHTLSPHANKWVTLAAAMALSLVLAALIERFVERPVRPRIRRGLQRSFDALDSRG